jgi:16S rRNA (adenine1518-N6/adenine1519-N6)-dimethyltransferase
MSSRQTQSFLIERMKEAGIRPQGQHGQNFLIDLNLLDLLVRTADPGPKDVVLEIGTGLGSLTGRVAQLAAAVVTVEIDPRLFALASEELSGLTNVTMLQQDALKNKNNIHPAVLEAVRHKLDEIQARSASEGPGDKSSHPLPLTAQHAPVDRPRLKLVANLPYNIATPILSNLLTSNPTPESLTATIQKELADRIVALPGTKDYSALSIWMQALCAIEIVREMKPQVFWPRPKVHSAIIHILPNPAKRALVGDLSFFHEFIRTLFQHRRKFLRGVLVSTFRDRLDKLAIDEVLAPFDLPPDARAEQLSVKTLIALAKAVEQRLPRPPAA